MIKKPAPITRLAVARRLGVRRATVERLVAEGRLKPVGQAGRSHLYDPRHVAALKAGMAKPPAVDADVRLLDYGVRAADAHARTTHLRAVWVSATDVAAAWHAHVATIGRLTESWPGMLAAAVEQCPADLRRLLFAADAPLVIPVAQSAEWQKAEHFVLALIAEAGWPLDDAAVTAMARAQEVQPWLVQIRGLERGARRADGQWQAPPPGWCFLDDATRPTVQAATQAIGLEEAARRRPAPILRPLFADLIAALQATDVAVFGLAAAPAADPLPPAPGAVAEARTRWLQVRAEYTRQRITVRRGHIRRTDLQTAMVDALTVFRTSWFTEWPHHVHVRPDDPAAARRAAARIRQESLATLGSALESLVEHAA